MRFLVSLLLLVSFFISFSQKNDVDNKYLEDQFYLGLYYSTLTSAPENFNQNKFSSTLNFGFIRDFPFNEQRNFGIGAGVGLSLSSLNSNLKLIDLNSSVSGEIVNGADFTKNKWNTTRIEFPFEVRWRTSTPTNYKFWRVYFGVKTSYLLKSKYKYESLSSDYTLENLPFRKTQSGITVNAGNNTWNLGLYMGLNPIFNKEFGQNNPNLKDLKEFKLGLVFYIL
ncbi:PorT family protein [Flavobacteriaceae bacterium]|nr:PorT family protein [Flavobacteriaceae bacterium]MDB0043227.1 PorT family protein [Flavobacteriaceae bacterium]